ncbi:MAG: KH domain-containing protein [Candidatus Micrarchaeaceae archaeon]
MEYILIPNERAALLDGKTLKKLMERLNCKIEVEGNEVRIEGASYDEYNAKNVIQAFARGFELDKAYRLLEEDVFFQSINIKDFFKSRDQLMRVKARVIGEKGRAKTYIEDTSGVDMAVYGGTVSTIGSVDELKIADAAIQILLDGGMHKTAYKIMEMEKRKIKERDMNA